MVKKHDHDYVPVVAGYTEPGDKPLTWHSCATCGKNDPDDPRPKAAIDHPEGFVDPDEED